MTRNELTEKLENVQNQIQDIINVTNRQVNIVANFRQTQATIEVKGVKPAVKLGFWAMVVVTVLFMGLSREWDLGLFYAACVGFVYYKRGVKSKLKNLALIIAVLIQAALLFVVVQSVMSGDLSLGIVIAVMIAVVVVGFLYLIRLKNSATMRKNRQIEEHNAQVQEKYDRTVSDLAAKKRVLYAYGEGWYPPKYYSLEAVNFFIEAIQNFQATNMKEAVQQFVQTQQFNQLMTSQKNLEWLGQQQVINQQQMMKEIRFANVLSMANLALQGSMTNAINANTDAVNNASYRSSSDASRVIDSIKSLRRR